MKTLTQCLITLFAGCVFAFTSFAGPEPIRDYKESKEVAPVPPPPCNWQGFYIGVNAGGTFGSSEATDIDDYNFRGERWSYNASGFVGGLEAGYNFQWRWLVLGVEGDVGYLGLDGSGAQPSSPDGDTIGFTNDGFYATFRGRIGASLLHDKLLAYATGGGIGLNNEVGVFDHRTVEPAGGGFGDGSSDDFRFGWTVGGGLAYAVTCHWSVKVEYLYYNLERERFTFHELDGGDFDFDTKTDGHIVRAGLDFKF
jgi:outer membrane immunogenic protein